MKKFYKDSNNTRYKREEMESGRVWWHQWRNGDWYVMGEAPRHKVEQITEEQLCLLK